MPNPAISNPLAEGLDEVIVRYVLEHHGLLIGAATAAVLYAVGEPQRPGATVIDKTATYATLRGLDPATGDPRESVIDRGHLNRYVDELVSALALDDDGRNILDATRNAAAALSHSYIGTEHFIVAFDEHRASAGSELIARVGGDIAAARGHLARFLTARSANNGPTHPGWTPRSIRAVNLAVNEANLRQRNFISSDLLALGVIADGEGLGANALASVGVGLDAARRALTST